MSGCGVQSELLAFPTEHEGLLCVRGLTLTALSVGLGEHDPGYRWRRSSWASCRSSRQGLHFCTKAINKRGFVASVLFLGSRKTFGV